MQALLFLMALLIGAVPAPSASARERSHRHGAHHKRHRHKHRRSRTAPGRVAATVFEAGPCGPPFPAVGTAPPDPNIVAAARQDAKQLLQTVNLPPGAAPANDNPAHLDGPPLCPATPDIVGFYELWTVSGDMQSTVDWVKAHPPQGGGSGGGGSGESAQCPPGGQAGPCRITSEYVWWSWPPIPGVSTQRSLLVTAVALSSTRVALRVDSQVVWLNPRPASETVPDGVASVTVVIHHQDQSAFYALTDPSQVNQAISLTNALPAAQPSAHGCLGQGDEADVTFRAADGTPLAQADADQACGDVTFSIDQQPQYPLAGGYDYVKQLESLVGFAGSPTP